LKDFNPDGPNPDEDLPPPPPLATPGSLSSPPQMRASFTSPPQRKATPTAAPASASKPAGIPLSDELVLNDEMSLLLPYHLFEWKDTSENMRTTLMILLPTGVTKEECSPRIVAGGTQIKMQLSWPPSLLDPRLPTFLGTRNGQPVYPAGHVKVASFKETVRLLKEGDERKVLKSVFRCNLPSTVEEQFCTKELPQSTCMVNFSIPSEEDPTVPPKPAKCLILEMMNHRTNYKAHVDIEEFALDFTTLAL